MKLTEYDDSLSGYWIQTNHCRIRGEKVWLGKDTVAVCNAFVYLTESEQTDFLVSEYLVLKKENIIGLRPITDKKA